MASNIHNYSVSSASVLNVPLVVQKKSSPKQQLQSQDLNEQIKGVEILQPVSKDASVFNH